MIFKGGDPHMVQSRMSERRVQAGAMHPLPLDSGYKAGAEKSPFWHELKKEKVERKRKKSKKGERRKMKILNGCLWFLPYGAGRSEGQGRGVFRRELNNGLKKGTFWTERALFGLKRHFFWLKGHFFGLRGYLFDRKSGSVIVSSHFLCFGSDSVVFLLLFVCSCLLKENERFPTHICRDTRYTDRVKGQSLCVYPGGLGQEGVALQMVAVPGSQGSSNRSYK